MSKVKSNVTSLFVTSLDNCRQIKELIQSMKSIDEKQLMKSRSKRAGGNENISKTTEYEYLTGIELHAAKANHSGFATVLFDRRQNIIECESVATGAWRHTNQGGFRVESMQTDL
jgi:hypothetical protein